jgi:FAD/FMN-containing dehydrogenase
MMEQYTISGNALAGTLRAALNADFQGELIAPDHPKYHEARKVWNGMIDRYPTLIARCLGVSDVVAAIRFAREQELMVAIRGGGHNVAGTAVCDDGLVIDLSAMKGLRVDPIEHKARAEAGVLWGEFDRGTQAFGLATTGGIVTHTGLAGLTLGGGLGWLMRKHGLTCDNLLEADVVTAEGRFLRVSETENEDLFWAVRGGGGNFGVVTSFKFHLHPLGPEVLAGVVVYGGEEGASVLRAYRDFVADAPDEVGTTVVLRFAPPMPWLPAAIHGQPVVIIGGCYAGPIEEAEKVMAPLRTLGHPLVDTLRPTTYVANQGLLDAGVPHGRHYYWKSHNTDELTDGCISTLLDHAWKARSSTSYTIIFHLGGAAGRVSEDAMAYSGRAARHAININAAWSADDVEGSADIEWTREMWLALQSFSTGGVYMNFLGNEGEQRVRAAYGTAKYARLAALKEKYDPTNFFRMNQNIRPAPDMIGQG